MTAAVHHFERLQYETKAEEIEFTLSADDLSRLGVYASTAAAQAAIEAATFELQVPALSIATAADVTVTATVGGGLLVRLRWQPPVSLTDAILVHTCSVVLEPGSTTSEDVICEGEWRVLARRAVV